MIAIENVLTIERTFCNIGVESKKRLLELMAIYMNRAVNEVPTQTIYEALLERERLGTTAIGMGVALPHARIEGLEHPVGVFMRLANGIDFGADDGELIDLAFGMIVPQNSESQYLNILSQLAERFRNPNMLANLRHCESSDKLFHLLIKQTTLKRAGQSSS